MRTVKRCALQTVEKLPEPSKHDIFTKESFCDLKFFFRFLIGIGLKLLIILHFDFLREPHSAVPLYADECGSLGFVAFSTVSNVSKNTFRHADAHRKTVRISFLKTFQTQSSSSSSQQSQSGSNSRSVSQLGQFMLPSSRIPSSTQITSPHLGHSTS